MKLRSTKMIRGILCLSSFLVFACSEKPDSKLIEECIHAGIGINKDSEKLGSIKVSGYKKASEKTDKMLGANELYHQYEGTVELQVNEDAVVSTYEVKTGFGRQNTTEVSIENVSSLKKDNEEIVGQLRKKIGQKPRGLCFSDCSGYTNEKFEQESKEINDALSAKLKLAISKDEKKTFIVQAVLGGNLDEKPLSWRCTSSGVVK